MLTMLWNIVDIGIQDPKDFLGHGLKNNLIRNYESGFDIQKTGL